MFLKIDGLNLLQIHEVGVSSCDIPMKVLESVDHREYRVLFQSFDTLFIVVFVLSPGRGGTSKVK